MWEHASHKHSFELINICGDKERNSDNIKLRFVRDKNDRQFDFIDFNWNDFFLWMFLCKFFSIESTVTLPFNWKYLIEYINTKELIGTYEIYVQE